jgi:hypothetical protein
MYNKLLTDNAIKIIIGSGNHNIFNLIKEVNKNKHLIEAKLKGQSVEGYNTDPFGFFSTTWGITIVIIAIVLWIWALIITIQFFSEIPIWAQILAILGLLGFGGPILTIIVVYIGKNVGPTKYSNLSFTNSTLGKRSMFLG